MALGFNRVRLRANYCRPQILAMANSEIDFDALWCLSVPERLQLVADLWDSIATEAPDAAFPMTPELAAELDRRWAEYEAHPETARPWEEVEAEIRQRLSKRKRA